MPFLELEIMQATTEATRPALEERLANGATVLFDMERRGETDGEYVRWLEGWVQLLLEYERQQAA
ncbi:MAG TPA: hypothetical protein VKX16_11450 [Chloroflexota bacterium]|nr:hypothetical protein [Chloroflexota bacterium]